MWYSEDTAVRSKSDDAVPRMSTGQTCETFKLELGTILKEYDNLTYCLAGLTAKLRKRVDIDIDAIVSSVAQNQGPCESADDIDSPKVSQISPSYRKQSNWEASQRVPFEGVESQPRGAIPLSDEGKAKIMQKISSIIVDNGNVTSHFSRVIERPEWLIVASSCFPCFCKKLDQEDAGFDLWKRIFVAADADHSSTFDIFVGFLILANCVVIMVQLEYQGYRSAVSLGLKHANPSSWQDADLWFDVFENVFNACFVLEILLRFYIFGKETFKDRSVFFDMALVIISSIQIYVLDPLQLQRDGPLARISLFRLLRFIRVVRVLRLVRVLKMFSSLRVLVKTVVSSFYALVWSMMLLLIIMVMGGMFLCELLRDWIRDEGNPEWARMWAYRHYGSSCRAIYTLFEVTLAGCWPQYFRPLIEQVSSYYVIFVVFYITIVVFAIIRIITAIFLKETLVIASNDADMMVAERMEQKQSYIRKLEKLFHAVDISGDGTLSIQEFELIASNPKVKAWLQVLELEVHDAKQLFKLLDDGDGQITYDEFLTGLMRLKGQARTMDVVSVLRLEERILTELSKIRAVAVLPRLSGNRLSGNTNICASSLRGPNFWVDGCGAGSTDPQSIPDRESVIMLL